MGPVPQPLTKIEFLRISGLISTFKGMTKDGRANLYSRKITNSAVLLTLYSAKLSITEKEYLMKKKIRQLSMSLIKYN